MGDLGGVGEVGAGMGGVIEGVVAVAVITVVLVP